MIKFKNPKPEKESPVEKLKSKKYERIYAMGEEKVALLREAMIMGISPFTFASKTIQGEWGLYTDVKAFTLGQMVDRWKNDNVTPMDIMEGVAPKTASVLKEKAAKYADCLEEMTELINLQKERLKLGMDTEKNTKLPMPSVTTNVQTLGNLLRNYGEIALKAGFIQGLQEGMKGNSSNTGNHKAPQGMIPLNATEAEIEHHTQIELQSDMINAVKNVFKIINGD